MWTAVAHRNKTYTQTCALCKQTKGLHEQIFSLIAMVKDIFKLTLS